MAVQGQAAVLGVLCSAALQEDAQVTAASCSTPDTSLTVQHLVHYWFVGSRAKVSGQDT